MNFINGGKKLTVERALGQCTETNTVTVQYRNRTICK